MANKDEMKALVEQLNKYRDAYYNNNTSLVTDEVYDNLFDKLTNMEEELGIVFSNSPTQTVGFTVQSELNKVEHDHPMLSLGKTKEVSDVVKFANQKPIIAMAKMDGLTASLSYDSEGNFVKAETRGNGTIGEDVTLNAKQISNIPLKINNQGTPLTIDGEVIIDWNSFNKINENLDIKYSHPRNLASGSIRQLDTKVTKERNLSFVAWRIIDGIEENVFSESLKKAGNLGFTIVPYTLDVMPTEESVTADIASIKKQAETLNYPIDGVVFSYADMEYGKTLGETSHHPQHSIAWKDYAECYETTLIDVEWSTSRTGTVNPVAIFDAVDLDGAITTRATLHNVSIMKELELGIGDTITVCRMNMVIPKVSENLTRSNTYEFPTVCPCCGEPLELRQDGIAEVLYCTNDNCASKLLSKFTHFVSKECTDIKGLSESTLEKLIGEGLIKTYKDIYHLSEHRDKLVSLEGFREKSADKLLKAIEDSRNIKLSNYINALGISNVGKTTAIALAEWADWDYDTFMRKLYDGGSLTEIKDFGEVTEESIYEWYNGNHTLDEDLAEEFVFEVKEKTEVTDCDFIKDKTFVITGSFSKPRTYYEEFITNQGGKLAGSVSKKTDYLLTDNPDSGSAKAKKAKELGIPVLSEAEFLEKVGK